MKNFSWKNNTVTHMHIELSNYCNAACPFCPRFVDSTALVRPDLRMDSITIDQFKEWFPPEFIENIERILFCGTHGDPMMCKDIIEITEYIQETSPYCTIIYHTNGGMRKSDFWKKLGQLLSKSQNLYRVIFSIDGLEDTNHLYRRNVKWSTLMENVNSYINAGGSAVWEFLTFGHNEHQIDEATKLSEDLGFYKILIKRALGFENKNGNLVSKGIYDKKGNLEYVIEPPNDKELINSSKSEKIKNSIPQKKDLSYADNNTPGVNQQVLSKLDNFNETEISDFNKYVLNFEDYEIKCKSCTDQGTSEIYVSCNGIVFPCCYVGTRVDSAIDLYEDTQLRYAINNIGKEKFDLTQTNIFEIIQNGYLDQVYTESWKKKQITLGKLAYCAMTCGKNSEIDRIYSDDRY